MAFIELQLMYPLFIYLVISCHILIIIHDWFVACEFNLYTFLGQCKFFVIYGEVMVRLSSARSQIANCSQILLLRIMTQRVLLF